MVGDVAEGGDCGQHQAPGAPRPVVAPFRLVELASLCDCQYISVCLVPDEPGLCRHQQVALCGAARHPERSGAMKSYPRVGVHVVDVFAFT